MSPRLLESVAAFKEQFGRTMEAIGEYAASCWDHGLRELTQHLAEVALAIATVSVEIGTVLLRELELLAKYLDPAHNKITKNMLDALNVAAVATRDFILGVSEHFDNFFNNGARSVVWAFADTFHKAVQTMAELWTYLMQILDGLLDHVDPITNELTRLMLGTWTTAIDQVGNTLLKFSDLIGSLLSNGAMDLINGIADIVTALMTLAGVITDEIFKALEGLFEHMNPENNANMRHLIKSLNELAEKVQEFVLTIGEAFRSFMSEGGQAFLNNIGDIVLILTKLAVDVLGTVISQLNAFFDSWLGQALIAGAAKALQLISAVLETIAHILEPLAPVIGTVVTAFLGFKAVTGVITGVSKAISVVSTVISGISGAFSMISGVVTTVTSVFGGFTAIISKVASIFGVLKGAATALWAVLAANPITLVVAAVAALVAGLVIAYNKCDWFREKVNGVFSKIKDLFSKINLKEALLKAFTGPFGNILIEAGKFVKKLKDKFNFKLPKFKVPLPKIQITSQQKSFLGVDFKVPKFSVKWARNGGIINSPAMMGGVGLGEAGAEAVIPLENSTFANTFAQAVSSVIASTLVQELPNIINIQPANNGNSKQDIVLNVDGRQLAKASIKSINTYQTEVGRTLLKV